MSSDAITNPAVAADLPWLRELARRLASDPDDADDLVQDTVLEASRVPASAARNHRKWLAGVLRNRWRMSARSQARRRAREAGLVDLEPGGERLPERAVAARQIAEALNAALRELEPDDRAIVLARYADDRNATEIGRDLGLAPSTVRTRLARSLARLRVSMDERCGPDPRVWRALVVVPPSVGSAASGSAAAGAMAVGVSTKTLAAVGTVVVAAISWWGYNRAASDPPDNTIAVAPKRPQPQAPPPTENASNPAVDDDPRKQWEDKLRRIRKARSARSDPEANEDTDDIPSFEQFAAEVREAFGGQSEGMRETFLPMVHELGEGLLACARDVEIDDKGSVQFRVSLIGDPDVGTVIESLEVVEGSDASAEIIDCAQASVYTANLPSPDESLFDVLQIGLDLEERTLSVGTVMKANNIVDILERYPELVSGAEADNLFEAQPELRDALRHAVLNDPSLTERFPDLASAVQDPSD